MLSFRRSFGSRPVPATLVPVSLTTLPSLNSAAIEGQSLSATQGVYAGTAPISRSWQWEISDNGTTGWAPTSGETSLTRSALGAGEVNKYVRIAETPSNVLGVGATQYSSAAQVTAASPPGSSTLDVTWTATDDVTATGYRFAWGSTLDAETYTQDVVGRTTESVTLTGLESGTLYLKMRALPDGEWYSLGPQVIA